MYAGSAVNESPGQARIHRYTNKNVPFFKFAPSGISKERQFFAKRGFPDFPYTASYPKLFAPAFLDRTTFNSRIKNCANSITAATAPQQ